MHDFIPLTVIAVRRETAHAVSVSLAVPAEHQQLFRFRPGQHLALRTTLNGEEVRRTYSICSAPGDPNIAIAIKHIPGGLFSGWACDGLQPNMVLDAMPPAGRFVLPDTHGEKQHILAFAAGAGITPIIAMAEHAMRLQPATRFTLVCGNRDIESIIFRERLEDLKDTHLDRFTLVHVLSRNEESDTPLLEGRITPAKVQSFASHLFRPQDIDHVFLCGPGSLIRDLRNALFTLGFPRDRVHHEFFAAGGGAYRSQLPADGALEVAGNTAMPAAADGRPASDPALAGGAEIVAVLDGTRHRFRAKPGETVIAAALRAGVRAPYSCKGGMCSTCRARVVEGSAVMRLNYSLEPWEMDKGFVLTCQAVATSPMLVVDYDQM